MSNKYKTFISILVIIVLASSTAILFPFKKVNDVEEVADVKNVQSVNTNETTSPFVMEAEKENLIRRNIDGVYVAEGEENYYPVAVMIDNHKDARPASGIAKANLVIEAEAEGGVTRYLAVFVSGEKIDEIGPIRSARPYFVNWAKEFNALYVHVGGSPDALEQIINDGVYDMNEFYRGSYFWRGQNHKAPHNVYISSDNLNEYLKKIKLKEGGFESWKFKDDELAANRPESSFVKINYLTPDFVVEWKYDRENNDYVRYLGGKIYQDANGDGVAAKNVVVQYAKAIEVDAQMRLEMEVIGSGKALVCRDGKCEQGIWKKKNKKDRTKFYQDDNEFTFNAGLTWINVARPYYKVEQIDK